MQLQHQVMVITGASRGIGAELARQLATRYGNKLALVLAGRDEEALQSVALACKQFGAATLIVKADICAESHCRQIIADTLEQFGSIDVLVNCAGRFLYESLLEHEHLANAQEIMRSNFWGSVWCTQAALPHLINSRGRIVCLAAQFSTTALPGRSAYFASKQALVNYFQAMAMELTHSGVSISLVYPDLVATRARQLDLISSGLKHMPRAVSVTECAEQIVQGLEAREPAIYISHYMRPLRYLHKLRQHCLNLLRHARWRRHLGV